MRALLLLRPDWRYERKRSAESIKALVELKSKVSTNLPQETRLSMLKVGRTAILDSDAEGHAQARLNLCEHASAVSQPSTVKSIALLCRLNHRLIATHAVAIH